jgi:hypothetical protein
VKIGLGTWGGGPQKPGGETLRVMCHVAVVGALRTGRWRLLLGRKTSPRTRTTLSFCSSPSMLPQTGASLRRLTQPWTRPTLSKRPNLAKRPASRPKSLYNAPKSSFPQSTSLLLPLVRYCDIPPKKLWTIKAILESYRVTHQS